MLPSTPLISSSPSCSTQIKQNILPTTSLSGSISFLVLGAGGLALMIAPDQDLDSVKTTNRFFLFGCFAGAATYVAANVVACATTSGSALKTYCKEGGGAAKEKLQNAIKPGGIIYHTFWARPPFLQSR